jgi:hypothetical protein
MMGVGKSVDGVHAFLLCCFLPPCILLCDDIQKNCEDFLFPDALVSLIEILSIYLKKLRCLNCLTVVKEEEKVS